MVTRIRFKLVLDPIARILEILAGRHHGSLTFTNVLSVSHAGEADVRAMLIASLGCNFAWGVIDAIIYLAVLRRQLVATRSDREEHCRGPGQVGSFDETSAIDRVSFGSRTSARIACATSVAPLAASIFAMPSK